MTTFIYILSHPLTSEVKYIGKSNVPKKRYINHCSNIIEIYKLGKTKEMTQKQIAKLYGIGQSDVSHIVNKRRFIEWINDEL